MTVRSAECRAAQRHTVLGIPVSLLTYHRRHGHAGPNISHADLDQTRLGEFQRGALTVISSSSAVWLLSPRLDLSYKLLCRNLDLHNVKRE